MDDPASTPGWRLRGSTDLPPTRCTRGEDDFFPVGGTLTLNVNSSAAAFAVGQILDLFRARGGVLTSTFSNFANAGSHIYGSDTFVATYTPTNFTLTVTSVSEPATWVVGTPLVRTAGYTLRRLRQV